MQPLISVVIPAYNREDIIKPTLLSIIGQDYGNLEIIVVDDASTDGTVDAARRILDDSSRDWRVLRHETNRGVSAARNAGIDAARGEYVVFIDSDDLADPDYISTLYGAASAGNCDTAFCGFRYRDKASGAEREIPIPLDLGRRYSGESLALKYMADEFWIQIGAIIFRRKLLSSKRLRFTEDILFGEDTEFFVKALVSSENVGFSAKSPFIYVQHDDMTTRRETYAKSRRFYADCAKVDMRLVEYMSEHVKSPEIKFLLRYWLKPEKELKLLKVYAWLNDREAFDGRLNSPGLRAALWASWRNFFRKPSVFLKSVCVILFPNLFFALKKRTSSFENAE